MKKSLAVALVAAGLFSSGTAAATPLTVTSPTGYALPNGVTAIGGLVIDMVGANGSHVVSQIAASSLFRGYATSSQLTIGTQSLLSAAVSALGGSLRSMAIRVSLFDGDTAAGNFDYKNNSLRINGYGFGDFSSVLADVTNSTGTVSSGVAYGFQSSKLSTGWFFSNNASLLASIYGSIALNSKITVSLYDTDYGDNYYDFKQGLDSNLVNVSVPVSISQVPEPATMALLGAGMVGVVGITRRRKRSAT